MMNVAFNDLPITCADDVLKLGAIVAKSGLFGNSVNSDEKGAAIVIMCHQEKMGLLEFRRTYHMMDNSPTMKADVMLAKLLDLGGDYEIKKRTKTEAAIRLRRIDGDWYDFNLTIDEVKAAGYCFKRDGKTLKDNWESIPDKMLWARVASDAIRVVEPRVNAGIYTQEEMSDAPKESSVPSIPQGAPAGYSRAAQESQMEELDRRAASSDAMPGYDPSKGHFEGGDKPETNIDYSIVPFGKFQGKRWKDLPKDTLKAVIDSRPDGLTDQHLAAAKVALAGTPF